MYFVFPGNGQALLCMPDIEILNILTIYCNAIGTKEKERDATNTAITKGETREQCYTNGMQEDGGPGRYYANTNSDSNLNPNRKKSQQPKMMRLNISFQVLTKTMTGEQVLKSLNKYKEIFKMF